MIKKYIGDKNFYKMVLAVALPIMIQNGITNFVNLLDNIMVGQVGTEQMSGVAIVNQLIFVFNLLIFGAVSGAGIFTAQYHGKGDVEGVRQTFRFKIITVFILLAISITIFATLNTQLIGLYLNDGSQTGDLALTLGYGQDYIWIMLIGLVPYGFSQVFGSTMRETEHTLPPMVAGFVAVLVNCLGNYLLIFGKLGLPVLGVKGAAIATVISRFVELGLLVGYTYIKKDKFSYIVGAFRHFFTIRKELVKGIFKKGVPLLLNEGFWAVGMSALAWCYSTRGLAAVAGYNISSTVVNVFNIAYMALGNSVGIIVGKYLGAGKTDEAMDVDRKLITFSVMVGFCMGVILAVTAKFFPLIYNTTEEVKLIATQLMWVSAVFLPFQAFLHACYFTLRSGGKTVITFLYDSVFVCCLAFPVTLIVAKCSSLYIAYMYAIALSLDLIKCVIGYILLKKRIWVQTIV